MPATTAKQTQRYAAAQDLAQRITWGKPQPKLTAEIAACECSEAARAGLYLLNGDWEAAHNTAQELRTALGSHWHALVHRHEPDPDNSKYWLHRTGKSPIYSALAKAAEAAGHGDEVAPKGTWSADQFTDAFSAANAPGWTRELDAVEMHLLLEHSLST